jgi:hypothetical protein
VRQCPDSRPIIITIILCTLRAGGGTSRIAQSTLNCSIDAVSLSAFLPLTERRSDLEEGEKSLMVGAGGRF